MLYTDQTIENMPSIFIKAIKIGLLAMMPLFLISNTKVEGYLDDTMILEGSYSLQVRGNLNQELKGVVSFETNIKAAADGTPFSTLELKLSNSSYRVRHSMGFLISRQNRSHEITVGTYRVAENIDGFLNDFDGVFGFANLDAMGELPFFAQKGKIIITRLTEDTLEGSMVVTLYNSNGKLIKVNGNFTATR